MTPTQLRRLLATFPWADWDARLQTLYAPIFAEMVRAGGADGAEAVAGTFEMDAVVEQFATRYIGDRIVTLQETTREEVAALIERAIEDAQRSGLGATPFDLGTRVREVVADTFDGYDRWRADRIARTETATAYNSGNLFALRQNGYMHVRLSDGGPGGCEECAAVDGQVWPLERAMAEPIAHPNCRRAWSPATEDDAASEAEAA